MKNKYEDIIINHYNGYEEDERLLRKYNQIEYLTTMRYIKKFAKKGAKILEIGAGTGKYSIELARQGFKVTAVDLTPRNIEILKENAKTVKNIEAYVGDALNLNFEDNQFDIVLCLGPMYHLFNQKDKDRAISESVRVCKPNGILMFAYLTHSSIVWNYGVRKNCFSSLGYALKKDGSIKDIPQEVFSSYFIDDFEEQFEKQPTTYITNVATDGMFSMMRDYVEVMNDEDFNNLIEWHFATCERLDHQGYSSHMLYICKKDT